MEVELYKLMRFDFERPLSMSKEEWVEGLTYTLNEMVADPYITINYVHPFWMYLSLSLEGARKLMDYLNIDGNFSEVGVSAYQLEPQKVDEVSDDGIEYTLLPSLNEDDNCGYCITFRRSAEDEQIEDYWKMASLFERCDNITCVEEMTGDTDVTGLISYDLMYYLDINDTGAVVHTSNPMWVSDLSRIIRFSDASDKNVAKAFAKYIIHVITKDILSKIDGYEESPPA